MIWLILQMLICLLIAFLIGCLVGWWFGKRKSTEYIDGSHDAQFSGSTSANLSASSDYDSDVDWDGDSLEAQLARCRSDLADAKLEIERLDEQVSASSSASASIYADDNASNSMTTEGSAFAADAETSSITSNLTAGSSESDNDDSVADFTLDSSARPNALDAPLTGEADDLQRIKGVGPKLEKTLHGLGIYHFQQIADFTRENVQWVDGYLTFKGRIDREDWIGQAKILAQGGSTDFSRRYDDDETS